MGRGRAIFPGRRTPWGWPVLSSSFRRGGARPICKDNYADHVSQITPRGRSLCRRYDGCTAHWPPVGALTGSNVRHNNNYDLGALMTRFGVPAGRDRKRSKTDALAEDGALNPAPEEFCDLKFQEGGFFDPGDIVQVKYEMLRRASVEKASVTEVSEEYGISRPTYYQAKADFDESGIAGLRTQEARSPRPTQDPGRSLSVPQGADFPWRTDTRARVGEVAPEGVRPRCPSKNDRTSGRCKKNSEMTGITASLTALAPATVVARYERLRSAMLGEALPPDGPEWAGCLSSPWHVGMVGRAVGRTRQVGADAIPILGAGATHRAPSHRLPPRRAIRYWSSRT